MYPKECPACQHINAPDGLKCSQCGQNLVPPMGSHIPPTAPPLQAGFNPAPHAKPKSSALVIILAIAAIVFVVGVLGAIGWGVKEASRSGVMIDGVELSKTDAKAGLREVREMMLANQAETGTKKPLVATNPLSKKYKGFIDAINVSETRLEKFFDASKLDEAMEASMSTKAERDFARKESERYDAEIAKYFEDEIVTLQGLQDFITASFKTGTATSSSQVGRLQGLKVGYAKVSQARKELLDFVDRVPPITRGKEMYLFERDADVAQFNKLNKALTDAGEAYDKLYAAGQQRADADFGSAMDSLHDL